MDKRLGLICGAIVVLATAFVYMSFAPNTAKKTAAADSETLRNNGTQAPPPPPTSGNKTRSTTPPPPPTGLKKAKKSVVLPEGYVNYQIMNRPEPTQQLKMGSTKLLTLDVKKGSENFTIEWFKKEKSSLKKVNIGNTFSVSPEKNVVYYVATIDDKVNEPESIFFQVEPLKTDSPAADDNLAEAPTSTTIEAAKVKPEAIATADTAVATSPVTKDEPTEEVKPVETEKEEVPATTEIFVITPTQNTDVKAVAGTPLTIGYKVDGDSDYEIFWFHKPFNKKKGSLIKKRKTLNFSLKKLNKYHSGYFYIQIKDTEGKFYKSPDYKVVVN